MLLDSTTPLRSCTDCGVDISDRYCNAKYCVPCADARKGIPYLREYRQRPAVQAKAKERDGQRWQNTEWRTQEQLRRKTPEYRAMRVRYNQRPYVAAARHERERGPAFMARRRALQRTGPRIEQASGSADIIAV